MERGRSLSNTFLRCFVPLSDLFPIGLDLQALNHAKFWSRHAPFAATKAAREYGGNAGTGTWSGIARLLGLAFKPNQPGDSGMPAFGRPCHA